MNARLRDVACALVLMAGPAWAAEMDAAKWSHRAAIGIYGAPDAGLAELALTPEAHDLAGADLADIRIVDGAGKEVPFVLRRSEEKVDEEALAVRLYNRTSLPDSRSVTVDFGEKLLKNRIEIATPGTDFRREVLVEGSDDGSDWRVVQSGAFLFRAARGPEGPGYDKRAVALPENDFRYLRITVRRGADDTSLKIDDVKAWRSVRTPPETVSVGVAGRQVVEKPKETATEIVFDLGWRNMPLYALELDFGDANFFRRVTVSGRNTEEKTVRTATEDGSVIERIVEAPWSHIATTAIYRYSSGGSVDESLKVGLGGASSRYVRVRIENRDDAPLALAGVKISRLVQYVAFQPKGNERYGLFIGNPAARMPGYDLARFARGLRDERVTAARMGGVSGNPSFRREERVVPWSERHRWPLWVALAGIGGVLALAVWRQARAARSAALEDAQGPADGD